MGSDKRGHGRTQYNIKNIKTRKTIRQGTFIHFKEQFENVTRKIHKKYFFVEFRKQACGENYKGKYIKVLL